MVAYAPQASHCWRDPNTSSLQSTSCLPVSNFLSKKKHPLPIIFTFLCDPFALPPCLSALVLSAFLSPEKRGSVLGRHSPIPSLRVAQATCLLKSHFIQSSFDIVPLYENSAMCYFWNYWGMLWRCKGKSRHSSGGIPPGVWTVLLPFIVLYRPRQ